MRSVLAVCALSLALACNGGSSSTDGGNGDAAPGDAGDHDPEDGASDGSPEAASSTDGPPEPFVPLPPCSAPSDYVEAPRAISTGPTAYSPACLRVPAGASVTIEASTTHPLEPRPAVAGGEVEAGTLSNPIPTQATTATTSFPSPGFFPFVCPEHIDQGMAGVVWVTAR